MGRGLVAEDRQVLGLQSKIPGGQFHVDGVAKFQSIQLPYHVPYHVHSASESREQI